MRIFKTQPWHVILLPLFFVLHAVKENFGFILPRDYLPLILLYCISTLLLYLLFYAIFRKKIKAGLLATVSCGIFFFYGFIQDFLSVHFPLINRYSILMPLFVLLLTILCILLKKTNKNFHTLNLYLNCVFFAFILFDLFTIITKTISPPADKLTIYPFAQKDTYSVCNNCAKPDIYLLVFDEYASSLCLRNDFGFDNGKLDTFLINKQFRIQKNSSGNYNFTPFSIASILNMSYISGINTDAITSDDYARCNKLIRENELVKYLSATGYDIINYSIFDIAGNPSPVNQDFLPLKARLITDRTLWGRVKRDILWNVFYGKFEIKWLTKNAEYIYNENNNKLINLVKKESSGKSNTPRFIYAHYNMPHPPYYFDKDGDAIEKNKLGHAYDKDKNLYLGYVGYTNTKIQELVNTILNNSKGEAVIIIMGDHGFRNDNNMPHHVFLQNQNAVYLPGKNYHLFYDSITGVNQFRVLINTLFKQNTVLLKDSTSFLKDVQ